MLPQTRQGRRPRLLGVAAGAFIAADVFSWVDIFLSTEWNELDWGEENLAWWMAAGLLLQALTTTLLWWFVIRQRRWARLALAVVCVPLAGGLSLQAAFHATGRWWMDSDWQAALSPVLAMSWLDLLNLGTGLLLLLAMFRRSTSEWLAATGAHAGGPSSNASNGSPC